MACIKNKDRILNYLLTLDTADLTMDEIAAAIPDSSYSTVYRVVKSLNMPYKKLYTDSVRCNINVIYNNTPACFHFHGLMLSAGHIHPSNKGDILNLVMNTEELERLNEKWKTNLSVKNMSLASGRIYYLTTTNLGIVRKYLKDSKRNPGKLAEPFFVEDQRPQVSKHLSNHLVRGVFDGKLAFNVSGEKFTLFTQSHSVDNLQFVKSRLPDYCQAIIGVDARKVPTLRVDLTKETALKFFGWLYHDHCGFYVRMTRKRIYTLLRPFIKL